MGNWRKGVQCIRFLANSLLHAACDKDWPESGNTRIGAVLMVHVRSTDVFQRPGGKTISKKANQSHDGYLYVHFYVFQQFFSKVKHPRFA
jgi:hypothetical protein